MYVEPTPLPATRTSLHPPLVRPLTPPPLTLTTQLTSRLEETPFAFPLISLGAFGFAGLITLVGFAKLRKLRKVGLGYRERDPAFGTPGKSHPAHSRLRAAANAWRDQSVRRGTRRRE